MKIGICILMLCFALCFECFAQSDSVKNKTDEVCSVWQPLGIYRQLTETPIKVSGIFYDTLFLNKDSDLRENRWTLTPLDEIDPAYQILLTRNPFNTEKDQCGSLIKVDGKVISPSGKLFDFKEAKYVVADRKIIFTTVERDNITYSGEMQFFDFPVNVKGAYLDGKAKLNASSKFFETVSKEFSFFSYSFG